MKITRIIFSVILVATLASCGRKVAVKNVSIIPEPVSTELRQGSYTLKDNINISIRGVGQNSNPVKYLMNSLRQAHIQPTLVSSSEKSDVELVINDTLNPQLGDEGYLLDISATGIRLSANTEQGLFYAYQTLIQILPSDIVKESYSAITLPECTIMDYPRYAWRGAHLDVSRHFFSVKFIKKYLDLMANYKLNRFHWHLTDDHGWRLPSEKYPLLNEIGSWRAERSVQQWNNPTPLKANERATYGGFYTKQEIAEIIDYAAARSIEVIPEIELPGHCSAILAAYPQLSCDGGPYDIPLGSYWPPEAILCAGNDSTLVFICDILDEVMELFPSQYIHIGGDEAVKDHWKSCPKCRRRMQEKHIRDEEHLQSWLMRQVADYLREHDRIPIGWDEAVDCGGLGTPAVIMAWRSLQEGYKAARAGYQVIFCPTEHCYLDYYQANPRYQPAAIGGLTTLAKAYSFDPAPLGTNKRVAECIIGGQCNLWSEFIDSPEQAEYMLLPRLLAISESLWSPAQSKNWNLFRKKIESQKSRLASKDYNYCEGSFTPLFHTVVQDGGTVSLTISTEVPNTYIFYTTDGTTPTRNSSVYIGPFNIQRGTHIKILPVYKDVARDTVYEYVIR